jgi:hypothetical protein
MPRVRPRRTAGTAPADAGAPERSAPSTTRAEVRTGPIELVDERDAGTRCRRICRHTVSDCACTPITASSTSTAPSSTRMQRSTSTVKST